MISFVGLIARGAYRPTKEIKKRPKDEARLYESNPKLRLLSIIGSGGDVASGSCPISMEKLTSGFIHSFIGVRSEEVALRLNQVS